MKTGLVMSSNEDDKYMLQRSYRALGVPNLQGERYPLSISKVCIDWVSSETTLPSQVHSISETYNGQELLMGSSFGGLAAWMFAAEYHPPELKGVILIDVLPKIELFPKRKAAVFTVLEKIPSQMAQGIYDVYRKSAGQKSADVVAVLERVQSIQRGLPKPCFSLPTMVVSSNCTFHQSWREVASVHQHVFATENRDLSRQVVEWIDGL